MSRHVKIKDYRQLQWENEILMESMRKIAMNAAYVAGDDPGSQFNDPISLARRVIEQIEKDRRRDQPKAHRDER